MKRYLLLFFLFFPTSSNAWFSEECIQHCDDQAPHPLCRKFCYSSELEVCKEFCYGNGSQPVCEHDCFGTNLYNCEYNCFGRPSLQEKASTNEDDQQSCTEHCYGKEDQPLCKHHCHGSNLLSCESHCYGKEDQPLCKHHCNGRFLKNCTKHCLSNTVQTECEEHCSGVVLKKCKSFCFGSGIQDVCERQCFGQHTPQYKSNAYHSDRIKTVKPKEISPINKNNPDASMKTSFLIGSGIVVTGILMYFIHQKISQILQTPSIQILQSPSIISKPECEVCLETFDGKNVRSAQLNCGHHNVCSTCVNNLKQAICPLCYEPIKKDS